MKPDGIDWKSLFGAYMDHVAVQEGTDYLWKNGADGVGAFREHCTAEQFEVFKQFVRERHHRQDVRLAQCLTRR